MLKLLWYYLKGYVIIEVRGLTVERFLNMTAHKGIPIWNIRFLRGSVTLNVSIENFRKLKDIARKTNCKYKIVGRYGAPFFFHRYRRRKVLFLGIPLFLVSLYFLTSFIWAVDIIGYERIPHEEIMQALESQGLSLGTFKHTIQKLTIEEDMLNMFDQMSFINISISGTRAIVSIAENIPPVPIVDRYTPTSLVADRSAIVQNVYVNAGEAMVISGDIVAPGDILISGVIIDEMDENVEGAVYYVHASGIVNAYVYYNLNFIVHNTYTVPYFTGRSRSRFAVNLLGRNINFPRIRRNFENYDTITSRAMLNFGENYPLPFILITQNHREYTPHTLTRDEESMQYLAQTRITQAIINYFPFEADIIEKQIHTDVVEQGLQVNATIITLQNIAQEKDIIFD